MTARSSGSLPAFTGRNSVRSVSPSDAPRAARSRLMRRTWASEVNCVLRRTGDPEAARWAGAELIMAAIDCDAATAAHVAKMRGQDAAPFTLSAPARRREVNDNEAGDRAIEAILRDELPPFGDDQ
jgi:hypothetical protein